jgi:hypothetical protein
VKLYRAGTELRCGCCDTLIATLRIDRTSSDLIDRDDWIFPGVYPLPKINERILCPKCGRPPKELIGEEIEITNQKNIERGTGCESRQKLLSGSNGNS